MINNLEAAAQKRLKTVVAKDDGHGGRDGGAKKKRKDVTAQDNQDGAA